MIVWVFIITLCCPGDAPHTIRWETPKQEACEQMQRTIRSQVRHLNATVGECEDVVEPWL